MIARSTRVPARHAAITPSGTATEMANTSVTAISDSVGSMRCAIILVTGRPVNIEVPRLASTMSSPHPLPARRQERPLDPGALADGLEGRRRRLVAGNPRRGIARRDVEQAEHEQRDHRHHGDGRENPPDDVGEHPYFPLTPTLSPQ